MLYRILHATPPAHRRRVVHLPDVRLRARPVRRDRGHHPLDLHARVRGPPAALRLVHRAPAGAVASRASTSSRGSTSPTPCSRSGSCCGSSTRATSAAGTTRGCRRSRASAGAASRPRAIRDFAAMIGVAKARQRRRGRPCSSTRCATSSTGRRRGGSAVLRPAQGRDRELPRGPGRGAGGRQQPRGPGGRARARCRSRASSGSSATTSWRTRRRSSSASRPGREVRLRYAYFVTCSEVVKDAAGRVVELRCTYDPATRGGDAPDGRRPKATLHWVSAAHAVPAEVRLYDHLFSRPDPGADGDLLADLNPASRGGASTGCRSSRRSADAPVGETRPVRAAGLLLRGPDSRPGGPVFNRTLTLRDTWAKVQAKAASRSRAGPGPAAHDMRSPHERSTTSGSRGAESGRLAPTRVGRLVRRAGNWADEAANRRANV